MKINIRAFGELLEALAKNPTIVLEDSETLGSLVAKLAEKTGESLESRILHDSTLTILINGRNIHTLKGFETTLKDGDTVTFIPFVVGG